MDWIFDHLNIVLLVGIAVASWVKSRMDSAKAEQESAPQEERDPESTFGPEGEWQEAYPDASAEHPTPQTGRPPSVRFSPVVPAHSTPPPLLSGNSDFSPSEQASLQYQQDLKDRLQRLRETRAVTTGGAAITRARVAAKRSPHTTLAATSIPLTTALRDRKQLRRALVTREILGPPIGLKS